MEFLVKDAVDADVPGAGFTFSQLKRAQAYGDAIAMEKKNLPVMTLELGKDALAGLKIFEQKLSEYLKSPGAEKDLGKNSRVSKTALREKPGKN
jgi:hypothetical protein